MAKKVLTQTISEPLDGAKTAKIDINPGDGNLTIESLAYGEPVLVSGALEYLENQGVPVCSVTTQLGLATLTLKSKNGKQPWLRMPWAACNGATTWQVHLNPSLPADISARSSGGNLRLDLAGMQITRVTAETGGGNIDLVLPDYAAGMIVLAKTGAGNVTLSLPGNRPARIHATTGLGKVMMDPCFSPVDKNTYQSPDYERAVNKVEITLTSGAGNVIVSTGAINRN